MEEGIIEVRDFSKFYLDFAAVKGISFTVQQGEIFGLLGPNGAGKTTTLECLEGLRPADEGEISVMGMNPARDFQRLVQRIGVQLQTAALPAHITVAEAVRLFAACHGIAPDMTLLEQMGLAEKLGFQYHALSTGQKRCLTLALAILHRPPILFLDEPTAGLDVNTRITLHQLIRELQQEGTTIILSTHDMAEAETIAHRVAILLRGQLVAVGVPKELTAGGDGHTKISFRTRDNSLVGTANGKRQEQQGEYTVCHTKKPGPLVAQIISRIEAAGDELIDLRVERPSLEERFLELTQYRQEER